MLAPRKFVLTSIRSIALHLVWTRRWRATRPALFLSSALFCLCLVSQFKGMGHGDDYPISARCGNADPPILVLFGAAVAVSLMAPAPKQCLLRMVENSAVGKQAFSA